MKFKLLIILCLFTWSTSIAQQEAIIKKYIDFGNHLTEKKRYNEAIDMYTNAINLNPEREELSYIYSVRGYAYLLNENDSLSIRDLQNSIIIDSKNAYSHNLLLSIYLDKENYHKAISTGEFAISNLGEDYYFRTQIAKANYNLKKYQTAIEQYTIAAEFGPINNRVYTMIGYSYASLDSLNSAKHYFDKASNYEENYYSHEAYGWYYRHIGNYDQAISNYKSALTYESFYDSYKLLAFTLIENDNELESIPYLDSALAIYPTAQLYHNRANSYAEIEEYDNAILDYKTALKIDSSASILYSNRAYRVWFRLKKYKLAKEDLLISINLNDSNDYAWNNLGYANFKLGYNDEAISNINNSIKINNENSHTYKNLALIYFDKKNYESSKTNALKALKLNYPYKNDDEFLKILKKLDITPS